MAVVISGTSGITSPGGDASEVSVTTPLVTNAGTLALSATGANIVAINTNGSERARIDSSGNLLVAQNTSTLPGDTNTTVGLCLNSGGTVFASRSGNTAGCFNRNDSNGRLVDFRRNGVRVGSVDVTTTATTYATSSDYRLKHDIAPMTGALARVALLKPCTYKWNVDDSADEGFIAHELAEVCPSAVSGEKDAVNEDGSINPQGIDTSFLAGLYAAALQELKAINDAQAQTIESLTARVVALENQIV